MDIYLYQGNLKQLLKQERLWRLAYLSCFSCFSEIQKRLACGDVLQREGLAFSILVSMGNLYLHFCLFLIPRLLGRDSANGEVSRVPVFVLENNSLFYKIESCFSVEFGFLLPVLMIISGTNGIVADLSSRNYQISV